MPHIVVTLWPGPSEKQKAALTRELVAVLRETVDSADESVFVAIDEVPSVKWMEKVYHPEIAPSMDRLYKKPGYAPF